MREVIKRLTDGEFGTWSSVGEGYEESMPMAKYYGFALGPKCDFDLVEVLTPDGPLLLTPGAVMPCTPGAEFSPRVRPSLDPRFYGQGAFQLHVLGFTNACELACRPRRAKYTDNRNEYQIADTAFEFIGVPFAGRRHAEIMLFSDRAITVVISGRRAVGIEQQSIATEFFNQALVAGTTVGFHIGGTDHEEAFDVLQVTLTNNTGVAANVTRSIWAWGELGE